MKDGITWTFAKKITKVIKTWPANISLIIGRIVHFNEETGSFQQPRWRMLYRDEIYISTTTIRHRFRSVDLHPRHCYGGPTFPKYQMGPITFALENQHNEYDVLWRISETRWEKQLYLEMWRHWGWNNTMPIFRPFLFPNLDIVALHSSLVIYPLTCIYTSSIWK